MVLLALINTAEECSSNIQNAGNYLPLDDAQTLKITWNFSNIAGRNLKVANPEM